MATFGFSVGDFLAGAELAIKLSKALSDSSGAGREYRELMAELNKRQSKDDILLEESERYHQSLKLGGSGNAVKDTLNKGRWAICMPEKVEKLRMSLASSLSIINTMVSMACNRDNAGYSVTLVTQETSKPTSVDYWPVPPGRKNEGEKMHAPIQGPVLIRRFVVVREGKWGCLCLEIHTHAGRGAGGEDD
ncbi:hypothetical protein CGMCC3_g370 [Colletotrichum fructicola]|nr:uncharacterized protein CGMCC3_g370 [Colletotrichum fructicola]KAE9584012.1 hypothetical protein CGMCC3_g370 [Colletotrichum fructicola]